MSEVGYALIALPVRQRFWRGGVGGNNRSGHDGLLLMVWPRAGVRHAVPAILAELIANKK